MNTLSFNSVFNFQLLCIISRSQKPRLVSELDAPVSLGNGRRKDIIRKLLLVLILTILFRTQYIRLRRKSTALAEYNDRYSIVRYSLPMILVLRELSRGTKHWCVGLPRALLSFIIFFEKVRPETRARTRTLPSRTFAGTRMNRLALLYRFANSAWYIYEKRETCVYI